MTHSFWLVSFSRDVFFHCVMDLACQGLWSGCPCFVVTEFHLNTVVRLLLELLLNTY